MPALGHKRTLVSARLAAVSKGEKKTSPNHIFCKKSQGGTLGYKVCRAGLKSGALAVCSIYVALNALGRCRHDFLGQ